jgi:hypothetical protein
VTSALEVGGWSAPRPDRFTPGKHPVLIVQEAGWSPGPVWTYAKNRTPTGIRSLDRPSRSQSLYRLSYPAHPLIKKDQYDSSTQKGVVWQRVSVPQLVFEHRYFRHLVDRFTSIETFELIKQDLACILALNFSKLLISSLRTVVTFHT